MSEEANTISLEMPEPTINLTLEPAPAAPVAAAVAEEPAAPEAVQAPVTEEEATQAYMANVQLTEEEQKLVDDFAQKIDIRDSNIVLQYGAASQKKIADFSDNALKGVKTKDLGEVSNMIGNLVGELKSFDTEGEQGKGVFGFFKKKSNDLTRLKARYDTVENNVDKICNVLIGHRNQLQKDIILLDKMYDSNLVYFKELTMYIVAGKKKLAEERVTTLVELRAKAEATGLTEDAQAANDFADLCDRFEKKLYDLELTRTISVQMAPQIRLIQSSNTLMVEKIQSTLNNTIPLWKNQMVLALGLAHSQQAMEAQREVNDVTNQLLRKNAETLKQGTVAIAQESERGIIDLETVKYSNEQLISTLDEVLRIQEEGRQKRRDAEVELGKIEAELKTKLLDNGRL